MLMVNLESAVLTSRALDTYTGGLYRWSSSALDFLGIVTVFPLEPILCALFPQYLLGSFKPVSTSFSPTLPGQVELLLMRVLEFLQEIFSAMAAGPQSLPRTLTSKTL